MTTQTNTIDELVRGIKCGDRLAFKNFYYLMQPSIFRFLFRYTADISASKDLLQDTFIKFWEKRSELDESGSPKAYLYRIARNLALNHVSRSKKRMDSFNEENPLIQLAKNPQLDCEMKFLLSDLQKSIILLPERCRVIFILSRYHDFDYQEIADILNISIQTVKNQMSKSLSLLRNNLSHYLE